MADDPTPSDPAPHPLGPGGTLALGALLILPGIVTYESFDKFFNTSGSHQCNAVFCHSRDTQVTHREVTRRGGQEIRSESVYYCAKHADLAEFDLLPRLWRLVVWLFVALCNLITIFGALAVVMKLVQGKGRPPGTPPA